MKFPDARTSSDRVEIPHLRFIMIVFVGLSSLFGCSDVGAPETKANGVEASELKGIPVPFCGDGLVTGDEECDPNVIISSVEVCCTGECEIAAAGAECRAGNGVCDPAEVCDGASIACPLNELAASGTDCDDDDLFCNGIASCDGGGTCNRIFLKCSIDSPVCDEDVDGCVGVCGDNLIGVGEDCEDGNVVTENCPYGTETCSVCGDECVTVTSAGPFCGDGIVQVADSEICDDGVANGTPGNCNDTCDAEIPIGEDCGNGVVDDGEVCDDGSTNGSVEGGCAANCAGLLVACYDDADGDGFAAEDAAQQLIPTTCPAGTSADTSDCNDDVADICAASSYPGNDELCDGCDNDCDPQTPDANDEAGIGEICQDGVSGICRTGTLLCKEGVLSCSCDATLSCFVDTDGDEFGTTAVVISADGGAISCLDIPGYATVGGDCDPDEPLCTTVCDDTDSDAIFDCADDCLDSDGDGYGEGAGCVAVDCDDSQSTCTDNCDQQSSSGSPCDGSIGDATDGVDTSDADAQQDATEDAQQDTGDSVSEDARGDATSNDADPIAVVSGGSGNGCSSVKRGVSGLPLFALFAVGLALTHRRRV